MQLGSMCSREFPRGRYRLRQRDQSTQICVHRYPAYRSQERNRQAILRARL